jgi:succinate-acetate transporter protein
MICIKMNIKLLIGGIFLIIFGIFYFFTNPSGFIVNELISLFFIFLGLIFIIISIFKINNLNFKK